jgi:phage terminase small subunit
MGALAKPAQEAFAQVYVTQGYNSRRAAAISGLHQSAIAHPAIKGRIRELMELPFASMHVDADRVKQEIARIAFQDVRDLYDDKGNLIPPHELSDDAAATIAGIDVEIKGGTTNAQGVTSPIVETRKIRRADKLGALNILAKHFKIIGDTDDAVGNLADALADRLGAARRRAHGRGMQDAQDVEIIDPAPASVGDEAEPARGTSPRPVRQLADASTDEEPPLW